MLRELVAAGMNVARLNFSHGSHEQHAETIRCIREIARSQGVPLAIMADLQGPKIRLGQLEGIRRLDEGTDITLVIAETVSSDRELPVPLPALLQAADEGSNIMLADGLIKLRVVHKDAEAGRIDCVVETGGEVSSHKGVNLPGLELDIPSLTEKDLADLRFALAQGVDYIAQSFVRGPADVEQLRMHIAEGPGAPSDTGEGDRPKPQIIAKIEKRVAVERLDDILIASDGVMVARGDLGVELGAADVPLVQKKIIRRANELSIPVITATQMLESMTHQPDPTRAEASDVANAILDGTTAVMLSGETAVGDYPVATVQVMDRIARAVEPAMTVPERYLGTHRTGSVPQALSDVACEIAEHLDAAAIVVGTSTGRTVRLVTKNRPRRPVIAVAHNPHIFTRMALDWGTVPVLIPRAEHPDDYWERSVRAARESGLVRPGDRVVFTAGTMVNMPGATNMLKVEEFHDDGPADNGAVTGAHVKSGAA